MDTQTSAMPSSSGQRAGDESSADTIVFLPRRVRQLCSCLISLLIGCVLAYVAYRTPAADGGQWQVGVPAAVLLVAGFSQVAVLLRGTPRLTLASKGVRIRTLFGTRTAAWAELGRFVPVKEAGRRARSRLVAPVLRATRIPGMAGNTVTVTDHYQAPLEEILAALDARAHPAATTLAQQPRAVLESDIGLERHRWPWLTTGIAAVLTAVFALEQTLAIATPPKPLVPSLSTLVALGGVSRELVVSGQWWRMLTAPFLHASPAHLLGNIAVMLLAGYRLERFIGRTWMLCLFLVGALAGSAGSIMANSADTVSVGASGAIMAMVAAMFVICFHLPAGTAKHRMLGYSARIAIPSLIPFSQTAGTMTVDYGAHGGGAVAGLLLGLVMLLSWRQTARLPGLRGAAAAAACLGVVAVGSSAALAARMYPAYAALGPLIPTAAYPTSGDVDTEAAQLLADYPDDPRASYLASQARIDAGDVAGGERLIRTAISKLEFQSWRFAPWLINYYRADLAVILQQQGRTQEAEDLAHSVCSVSGAAALQPSVRRQMASRKLCGSQ